uniref:Uncharacterized protein n=1 Tax=Anguilla anguilla TaxID=7936 RepID=A0A0E9R905_ANGAN
MGVETEVDFSLKKEKNRVFHEVCLAIRHDLINILDVQYLFIFDSGGIRATETDGKKYS